MRIRVGNFKSDDLPELEFIAGTNVAVAGVQGTKEVQVTISSSGGGGGGSGIILTPVPVQTVSTGVTVGSFVPVDTTAGPVTLTLPNFPVDGSVVAVKQVIQGGSNAVTVATGGGADVFNKAGGATSLTVPLLNQGMLFQYQASTAIWYVITSDLSLASLDTRYAAPAYAVDTIGSGTDIATNNVTSTKHGLAPKSPADATRFLNGAATPVYVQVKDSDLATSDVTSNNVSTSKHGFAPKGAGTGAAYLDDTGVYTVPAGAGVNAAWSSTLAATASSGATALQVTSPIPWMGLTSSTSKIWVVIDAWTTTAEVRVATPGSDSLHLTVAATAVTHSAGASVIVVEDRLHMAWFGVKQGATVTRTGQATAANRMITQAKAAGLNRFFIGPGVWLLDGALDFAIGGAGIAQADIDGGGATVTWSDSGAGASAIYLLSGGGSSQGSTLKNINMVGPAAGHSGLLGVDPACMDGIYNQNSCLIENVTVQNFRNGITENGFNHSTYDRVIVNDCYYGIYRATGASQGDNTYKRVILTSNRLAGYGQATGMSMLADSWYDCHNYGQPVGHLLEPGSNGFGPIWYRMSIEQLGNCVVYSKGSGGIGINVMESTSGPVSWNHSTYGLPSPYPNPCVIYNDSGTNCTISLGGDISALFPDLGVDVANIPITNTGAGANNYFQGGPLVFGGGSPDGYWAAGITINAGSTVVRSDQAQPLARVDTKNNAGDVRFMQCTPGTITRGMLLNGGTVFVNPYPGSGPYAGVALERDSGAALTCVATQTSGDAVINVLTTTVASCTTTSGSPTVTASSFPKVVPRQAVTGTGIPANTTVLSVSGGTLTLSANATASGTVTLTFGTAISVGQPLKPDPANNACVVQAANVTSAPLDFPNITAQTTATPITMVVTGAIPGEQVSVSVADALESGLVAQAWVSGYDTVSVTLTNVTGGGINPASHTFTVCLPAQIIVGFALQAAAAQSGFGSARTVYARLK